MEENRGMAVKTLDSAVDLLEEFGLQLAQARAEEAFYEENIERIRARVFPAKKMSRDLEIAIALATQRNIERKSVAQSRAAAIRANASQLQRRIDGLVEKLL